LRIGDDDRFLEVAPGGADLDFQAVHFALEAFRGGEHLL